MAFRKRDKATSDALLKQTKELQAEIKQRWPELQKEYRAALPRLTSHEEWGKIFDAQ